MRMLPVLLIAALFCPMSTFATARAETITLAADEWAPYNSVPNIQPEGYMVDVVREIFKSHGIEVVYHMVPWQRALEGSRKGAVSDLSQRGAGADPTFLLGEKRKSLAFHDTEFH